MVLEVSHSGTPFTQIKSLMQQEEPGVMHETSVAGYPVLISASGGVGLVVVNGDELSIALVNTKDSSQMKAEMVAALNLAIPEMARA
jgi:hypothetical protein